MGRVKLKNGVVSMFRHQPAKRLANKRGEIMNGKMGRSWVTAEGNVAKGPSLLPFWLIRTEEFAAYSH